MLKTMHIERLTPESHETLLTILETLPGALFVLDDASTILYANPSAQTLTGAASAALVGNSFWRSAPRLVSTTLYQAIQQTKQTRTLTEVRYVSPVTGSWLHVHLSPTSGGLTLQFHEIEAPAHTQEMVPQRESLYMDVLDHVHAGILFLTPEGIVLDLNEVPLDDAQIRREEVVGKPLVEGPWWSSSPDRQQLDAAITRASRGETVHFEALVHPRKGRDLSLEVTILPQRDAEHHIAYLVVAGIDITERKRAEAELHAQIETIPQLVWIARPDGYVTYHNHRLLDSLATTQEQVKGTGWLAGVHPDDRQQAWQAWQTAIQTGEPYEGELRLQDGTSGVYRWFLARAVPQCNAQGSILHWVGTCTDIEEQKRAEQQLRESRESLRVLAETVPQLVWVVGSDGLYEYTNQRCREYIGAVLEQMQSDPWAHRQFIHPDDQEDNRVHTQHALDVGTMFENKGRIRNAQTGEYRWFLLRAMPMHDDAGKVVKWFGTCTDIDEQKRIEEALRQSQERASVLMNSNIIGITVFEGEQIVDANDTFLRMTGYTHNDLRAGRLNWISMTPPEDLARTLQAQQELATRQSMTPYEKAYFCHDGSRLPVLVGAVVLQHHPSQTIGFVLDNSARKELEQRKDDFISMASHELRNPLTALQLRTTLLQRQLTRQGSLEQLPALARMEAQIKTMTRLVTELLDVSRIQAGKLEYVGEVVDLDALLREIIETMQHIHPGHTILVRGSVQTSLIGDPDRLGQVFTNLLSNAIKYAPGAQTVEVDLSTSEEAVTIRVRDHGLGIPHEQCDKIFERFYRVTDPKQKGIAGLGMGLYIVSEIVKHHGGTITVDSEVGKGSTFTVALPTRREV